MRETYRQGIARFFFSLFFCSASFVDEFISSPSVAGVFYTQRHCFRVLVNGCPIACGTRARLDPRLAALYRGRTTRTSACDSRRNESRFGKDELTRSGRKNKKDLACLRRRTEVEKGNATTTRKMILSICSPLGEMALLQRKSPVFSH